MDETFVEEPFIVPVACRNMVTIARQVKDLEQDLFALSGFFFLKITFFFFRTAMQKGPSYKGIFSGALENNCFGQCDRKISPW